MGEEREGTSNQRTTEQHMAYATLYPHNMQNIHSIPPDTHIMYRTNHHPMQYGTHVRMCCVP